MDKFKLEYGVKYTSTKGHGEIIAVFENLDKAIKRRDQLKAEGVKEIYIVGRKVGEWQGLL